MVSERYPRLLAAPKQSFFLFGPRGVGKSHWAKESFGEATRFDLLDEALFQELLVDPGALALRLRAKRPGSWVVLDEIQRLPSLLNTVHAAIEGQRLKFVLTGSSARKLKTAGTNLLAGRALTRRLHPFVPEELGADFDLDAALGFGTLPIVWQSDARRDTLEAYVLAYLREEVQAEALVRNLPGFARFLPIATLFHAQTLNMASLARDAGVARTTVVGYLDILVDTQLAFTLPAYEARLRVRERKHPKLYWADPGIVRAIRKDFSPPGPETRGALFEGYVAQLLRAYGDYRRLFDEWFYWAPADAATTEVDFLLRRGREHLAIEVKSSKRVTNEHLKGLRAVGELRGLVRRLVVYLGAERGLTEDGVELVPFPDFADMLAQDALWPG